MPSVVDTNVLISANGRHTHASQDCQIACIDAIQILLNNAQNDPIAIDDKGLILDEYNGYLNFHGQPGVGDLFYKFIHDRMYAGHSIVTASVTPCHDSMKGFEELPNNRLDRSDRKFLAVAVVSRAEIINATDSDWADNYELLHDLGIKVIQVCPEHSRKR